MRIILFASILTFICCKQQGKQISAGENNVAELFITTKTFSKVGSKMDSTIVISKVDTDYFAVDLQAAADNSLGFIAEKKIENPSIGKPFRMAYLFVSDKTGADVYFKTNSDFLNYMSERGYEQASSYRLPYGYEYSFKRKLPLR